MNNVIILSSLISEMMTAFKNIQTFIRSLEIKMSMQTTKTSMQQSISYATTTTSSLDTTKNAFARDLENKTTFEKASTQKKTMIKVSSSKKTRKTCEVLIRVKNATNWEKMKTTNSKKFNKIVKITKKMKKISKLFNENFKIYVDFVKTKRALKMNFLN